MKRSRVVTIALSVLTTLAIAVPTQAAEPVIVDLYGCVIRLGGEVEVPRRTNINLVATWRTEAHRQAKKFLDNARAYARIDGVKVPQANQYWATPRQLGEPGEHFWDTTWWYPAGQLTRGEALVVKFQITLRERQWDGFQFGWYEAGRVFDPPLKCTITAS